MAGTLDRWSRKAQAKSEQRNAKAMQQPRPGELKVEDCERIIGEPVLWAITATRGERGFDATTLVDATPIGDVGLAVMAIVGAARGLRRLARTIRREPAGSSGSAAPDELPDTLALAGTRDAIVELVLAGPHPTRIAARHERPVVTLLGTYGYWQKVRIDDQELWVMTHLSGRVISQARAWREQS